MTGHRRHYDRGAALVGHVQRVQAAKMAQQLFPGQVGCAADARRRVAERLALAALGKGLQVGRAVVREGEDGKFSKRASIAIVGRWFL